MLNILLIDNDFSRLKNIINTVFTKLSNFNLYGITTNKQETFKFIKTGKIDIIILNTEQNNVVCNELMKFIVENNYYFLKNSIILLNNNQKIKEEYYSYIYEYITVTSNIFECLFEILNRYYLEHEKDNNIYDIKKIISDELKYLRFNYSYNGTRYLQDTILELYKQKNYNNYNLQKDIYPIIANKYHKSINNIKTSIALSIKMMCIDCKDNILKEYFYLYDSEVPKIKEVICIIFENIIYKKRYLK